MRLMKFRVPFWALTALCGPQLTEAFTVPVHKDITTVVSKEIHAPVRGVTRGFSDRAVQELADADGAIDDGFSQALFHPERHFTNEEFAASSRYISDNYDASLAALRGANPDGSRARELIGGALHTIQDFYSHSTWVESGNVTPNAGLGHSTLFNPPLTLQVCPGNRNFPLNDGVTSAYYKGALGCGPIPAGKCWHGNWVTPFACPDEGINKDRPVTPRHAQARSLAEQSSQNFIEDIVSALAGNDPALAALFDLKGSVGFVIDDTGSMSGVIGGVQTITRNFVSLLSASPDTAPDQWILESFNDPSIGTPLVTKEAAVVSSAIGGLFASGGGDCPELSQAGILAALGKVTPNSRLFVFTDASAKDSARVNEVISLAQATKTRLSYLLSGSCSPVDTAYVRGAAETGGQLYLVNRNETARLQSLIGAQLTGDLVSIVSQTGISTTSVTREIDVPVDSSISRLVVSAIVAPATTLSLQRPDGSVIAAGQPGVEVINLAQGAFSTPVVTKLIVITTPVAGRWHATLVGSGEYTFTASGNSTLDIGAFDFVRPGADLHGGWFPIEGQPQQGTTVNAVARLVGAFSTATFQFLDEGGNPIGAPTLVHDENQVGPGEFFGTFALPNQPFRISVSGTDTASTPFLRQFPVVFRGQPVSIEINGGGVSFLPAGVSTNYTFTIKNVGPATTFNVRALSSRGFSVTPTPATLNLAAGATAQVSLAVLAPASTPTGVEDHIVLTVTKSTDTAVFNSASLTLQVSGVTILGDVNADGVVDCKDMQAVKVVFGTRANQIGFDPRADLNRDNVIDVRDLAIVSRQLPAGTTCN